MCVERLTLLLRLAGRFEVAKMMSGNLDPAVLREVVSAEQSGWGGLAHSAQISLSYPAFNKMMLTLDGFGLALGATVALVHDEQNEYSALLKQAFDTQKSVRRQALSPLQSGVRPTIGLSATPSFRFAESR